MRAREPAVRRICAPSNPLTLIAPTTYQILFFFIIPHSAGTILRQRASENLLRTIGAYVTIPRQPGVDSPPPDANLLRVLCYGPLRVSTHFPKQIPSLACFRLRCLDMEAGYASKKATQSRHKLNNL